MLCLFEYKTVSMHRSPARLKGMEWANYERLERQYDVYLDRIEHELAGLIMRLGGAF